ncbi:MAG: DUF1214 domain-containing protein [Draconibacterium sp.]|nr:DUF1214 domain-containing protein [Draconibacterium sp.]
MKKTLLFISLISLMACAQAQEKKDVVSSEPTIQVTVENYARAESDFQSVSYAKNLNCFGKLVHQRDFYSVDNQLTVRLNRDTYYSFGVFDLTSPLTIVIPESGDRFLSLMLVNQDHSILPAIYDAGTYVFTQEDVGTRYLQVTFRTFVDANDPEDVKKAHELQDQFKIEQAETGTLDLPNWDQESRQKIMDAINVLAESMPNTRGFFGEKDKLDPLKHLMGTAYGYGGNPDEDAVYFSIIPEKNDGNTTYSLTVKDVPVDGFWSITVYNSAGYMEKNEYNSYSINNKVAKKNEDGSFTINFGGDPKKDNYLYTFGNWSYVIRLYQPHKEILDGVWEFPKLQERD